METTIVQPGASPSIYTTADHRGHGGYGQGYGHGEHRNHLDELIAREQAAGFRTAAQDTQTVTRDIKDTRFDLAGVGTTTIRDIKDARHDLSGAITTAATASALASCKSDDRVGDGFAGVDRGFSSVHDRLCDGFSKVTGALVHGTEESAHEYEFLQKQISDAATSTLVGFKDLTALSYQIQGANLLEQAKNASAITVQATANANAISVQAQNYANLAQVQALTNFNALNVEMVKNAAAAELRAQQIAAQAAAQAAECCCELKSLITADGNTTRALINTNTVEQLRAQLVATQRLLPVTVAVGTG